MIGYEDIIHFLLSNNGDIKSNNYSIVKKILIESNYDIILFLFENNLIDFEYDNNILIKIPLACNNIQIVKLFVEYNKNKCYDVLINTYPYLNDIVNDIIIPNENRSNKISNTPACPENEKSSKIELSREMIHALNTVKEFVNKNVELFE
jgi:hypothetical protein